MQHEELEGLEVRRGQLSEQSIQGVSLGGRISLNCERSENQVCVRGSGWRQGHLRAAEMKASCNSWVSSGSGSVRK